MPGERIATSLDSRVDIGRAVEHAAHFLPAQGPISVFVHHNTLHAFEHERFEDAVINAGRRLGCEPFLSEEAYRDELGRGRIAERDVEAVLETELGDRREERIVGDVVRGDLWRRVLIHGTVEARGAGLSWRLDEGELIGRTETELFRACLDAVGRSQHRPPRAPATGQRHRDLLVAAYDVDPDEWIRPVQIRFVGAYLDQGFAQRPMPGRERGLFSCFQELYGRASARFCGAWAAELIQAIFADRSAERDAFLSLAHSLEELGVRRHEWPEFLAGEALWLRGWAGMVRAFETRPDRVPALAVPARLVDYLAVQLLLLRAALRHAVRRLRVDVPLHELRTALSSRLPAPVEPSATERAWPIFQVARLCEFSAAAVAALTDSEITRLESELGVLDGLLRRRLLHLAYERHLRHRFHDALLENGGERPAERPAFQAIFCIDEREESIRRHLEEVDPKVETFGAAGFFGVAMYYRGAQTAHARPLCPVAIQPEHYVAEGDFQSPAFPRERRPIPKRLLALFGKGVHLGSRTFGRGALITLLGVLWLIPLVLRVLFPWSRRGLSELSHSLSRKKPAPLQLDRAPGTPPLGRHIGFSVEEMADIVFLQLGPLGILDRMAPLVFVLGHGSSSLNNPHESAHDCGACGGGRGGPNARVFARMANDPRVRARLVERGLHIPNETWFVGGQRNSANNDLDFYDEDLLPDRLQDAFERARVSFELARRREAHERCRRFEAAPPFWLPEQAALHHVQTRAVDLAQPRPEYGHASNALCVVGRRARTLGLFLDRRAFLVSYDPLGDPDAQQLAGLLASLVPVVAGINLEYFFGYVDPTGYGSGTKLPHNVSGLIGVMDGAQSDLRAGLPWQMLEIHEPVRLSMVVEASPHVLWRVLDQDESLKELVKGRWIFLAALEPGGKKIFELDATGLRPYLPEQPVPVVAGSSRAHYAGQRGHLPFALMRPPVRTTTELS